MRRRLLALLPLLLTSATLAPHPLTHVFVIVLENHSLASVLGNPNLPTLNHLADTYGLATNYTGVTHPSLPNYVAMLTGSDFGSRSDDPSQRFDGPSLPDQLEASGRTWKGYFQGLPQPGWDGPYRGNYAKKHNPFMLLARIANDPARAAQTVPLEALGLDLNAAPPNFALIVPDLCHDMHGAPGCRDRAALDRAGDRFVNTWAARIMGSPVWGPGAALVVTFDEGSGGDRTGGGGRLATIVVTPDGPRGVRSERAYNHASLLRTLQDGFGLPPLGDAARALPMGDLF